VPTPPALVGVGLAIAPPGSMPLPLLGPPPLGPLLAALQPSPAPITSAATPIRTANTLRLNMVDP
jgi:hypothetical protein